MPRDGFATSFASSDDSGWDRISLVRPSPSGKHEATAGLRLLECLTLPIKELDFGYHRITVRAGKGNKDRVTILPVAIEDRLRMRIDDIRIQFEKDLKEGGGYVRLPKALALKYVCADRAWGWQWVFRRTRSLRTPEPGGGIDTISTNPSSNAR